LPEEMKEEMAAGVAEAQQEAKAEPEGAEAGDAVEGSAENEAKALKEELEKLSADLKVKEERVLRLQADFENYRRRTSKEREEIGTVVEQGFLQDLLPLLDNFDRAMAAEEKDGKAFKAGVEMIFKQLGEVLKNHGLEEIDCVGKMFDPAFHQAVMRVENDELEDDSIAMVLQKGYMAKGRVIRPSMVQVVANS